MSRYNKVEFSRKPAERWRAPSEPISFTMSSSTLQKREQKRKAQSTAKTKANRLQPLDKQHEDQKSEARKRENDKEGEGMEGEGELTPNM